jgi:hypothetical protein
LKTNNYYKGKGQDIKTKLAHGKGSEERGGEGNQGQAGLAHLERKKHRNCGESAFQPADKQKREEEENK